MLSSDSVEIFVDSKTKSLTSHKNVNLSVLEADLGSSLARPT